MAAEEGTDVATEYIHAGGRCPLVVLRAYCATVVVAPLLSIVLEFVEAASPELA